MVNKKNAPKSSYSEDGFLDASKYLLSIGKAAFVKIMYPAIKSNPDITVEEIAAKYPAFANFKSQDMRLKMSRKVFKEGAEFEALQLIVLSKKVSDEIKEEAQKFIDEYND